MEQLTKNQAVATSQEAVQNQNEPQLRDENAHNDKSVHGVLNPTYQAGLRRDARSEERFSRNAETDLVCRLLLEKSSPIPPRIAPRGRRSVRPTTHVGRIFFFNDPAPTEIYTLSLHDALPISVQNQNEPQLRDENAHNDKSVHGVLNPTYQAGLRRDAVQPDIEAERKKRDEIEAGKSYCSRRFGGATCDDKSAQIYARFDKNDWRIQPAEFYRFHDAEVNTFGYF